MCVLCVYACVHVFVHVFVYVFVWCVHVCAGACVRCVYMVYASVCMHVQLTSTSTCVFLCDCGVHECMHASLSQSTQTYMLIFLLFLSSVFVAFFTT